MLKLFEQIFGKSVLKLFEQIFGKSVLKLFEQIFGKSVLKPPTAILLVAIVHHSFHGNPLLALYPPSIKK